jgi:DNA-binding transcriptional MocR family regulator
LINKRQPARGGGNELIALMRNEKGMLLSHCEANCKYVDKLIYIIPTFKCPIKNTYSSVSIKNIYNAPLLINNPRK